MSVLQAWGDYLVAQVTASAALTGLIFVVLSFNFDQIVGDKAWLGRAGTGLILLAQPTVFGMVGLLPVRTTGPLGGVLAATAIVATVALVRIALASFEHEPRGLDRELAVRLTFTLAGSIAVLAGSLALAADWRGGLYLIAAGGLISISIGLVIAWVLLVEVRRGTV